MSVTDKLPHMTDSTMNAEKHLTEGKVRAALDGHPVGIVDVLAVTNSTNAAIADSTDRQSWHRGICLARQQTAGRGRRGRVWEMRPDDDIPMSLGWRYESMPPNLPGISLAIGVASAECLERLGARGVGLKWPNDLYAHGRKLAGILVQSVPQSSGGVMVVAGIGLNMSAVDNAHMERIGTEELGGIELPVDRNELVADIVRAVHQQLEQWPRAGIAGIREAYGRFDLLEDRAVTAGDGPATVTGTGAGLGDDGALLIRTDSGTVVPVYAGDATILDWDRQ